MTRRLTLAVLACLVIAGCTAVDYHPPPIDPVGPTRDGSGGSGGGGGGM
jgi:hypothetical protein